MKRVSRSAALKARILIEKSSSTYAAKKRKSNYSGIKVQNLATVLRMKQESTSSRRFSSGGIRTTRSTSIKVKNEVVQLAEVKTENKASTVLKKTAMKRSRKNSYEQIEKKDLLKDIKSEQTSKDRKPVKTVRNFSPKKKKQKTYTHKPPKNWERTFELMYIIRANRNAPVDSMGAEILGQRCHGKKVFRYQTLIALMLSSQTKDQMVSKAMKRLQEHGLTVENINKTSESKLRELIYGVGFHNRKTEYIKKATNILIEKFDGDIPNNVEDMVRELPGVGPKMAYLTANIAFDKPVGIGVDVSCIVKSAHKILNQSISRLMY